MDATWNYSIICILILLVKCSHPEVFDRLMGQGKNGR